MNFEFWEAVVNLIFLTVFDSPVWDFDSAGTPPGADSSSSEGGGADVQADVGAAGEGGDQAPPQTIPY